MTVTNQYLEKHLSRPLQLDEPVNDDLGMIVVIPCFDEPHLISTLQSIWDCERPNSSVEVIVVVNSSDETSEEKVLLNLDTFFEAAAWSKVHKDHFLKFHILQYQFIPSRVAGVGMARKIGMDEAVARFEKAHRPHGVIVNLDADCLVRENYLVEIEKHFRNYPETDAASIYFEHPLKGEQPPRLYEGIIRYELFLRYYIQGLRYSGYPYSYHTVGSCMATKSSTYQKQSGMNKRKAGEDFHFLHKFMPLGHFSEINTTKVIPSPRISGRVPFGTGKAMLEWMKKNDNIYPVYHPRIFEDLFKLLNEIPALYKVDGLNGFNEFITRLPQSAIAFLTEEEFLDKWQEIQANVGSEEAFGKRIFQWFNGLKVLQYIHYCRDHFYGELQVEVAANKLLEMMGRQPLAIDDAFLLLEIYRELDQSGSSFEVPAMASHAG